MNAIDNRFCCPVDFEPLTTAVTLMSCCHKINEAAAITLFGYIIEGKCTIQGNCPICRTPVTNYAVDHTFRELVKVAIGEVNIEIQQPEELTEAVKRKPKTFLEIERELLSNLLKRKPKTFLEIERELLSNLEIRTASNLIRLAQFYQNYGNDYLKAHIRYTEAIQVLEQSSTVIHWNLKSAVKLENQQNYDKARKEYSKALKCLRNSDNQILKDLLATKLSLMESHPRKSLPQYSGGEDGACVML